ncbi:MAG: hypothetical protein HWN66_14810 [Candidatus Helarchaeota archaeon]|nr:hypothetical protein [Candidatus Helarchaeota archaeon]
MWIKVNKDQWLNLDTVKSVSFQKNQMYFYFDIIPSGNKHVITRGQELSEEEFDELRTLLRGKVFAKK